MLPQDSGSSKIIFVKDNCVENFSFLCFMIYFFFLNMIISFISNGKGVRVRAVLKQHPYDSHLWWRIRIF